MQYPFTIKEQIKSNIKPPLSDRLTISVESSANLPGSAYPEIRSPTVEMAKVMRFILNAIKLSLRQS